MIHLVVATDRAYLPWTATVIRSALDHHAPGEVAVHVVHDGAVAGDDARRLTAMGDALVLHELRDPRLGSLPLPRGAGPVTWFRIALADALPDLDRALLLDADTLVAAPLHELWGTDLGTDVLAAVSNVVEPRQRARVRSLGLDDHRDYFNAGVLLLDLARMRNEDASGALFAYAAANAQRIPGLDQDVLNAVFARRWRRLHPRFNAMNSLWMWRPWACEAFGEAAVDRARSAPVVLHFEGPGLCKPWHVLNDHPRRDDYREVLARTPWSAVPLEDDTAAVRAIGRLPSAVRVPAYWRYVILRERVRSRRQGT